MTKGEHYKTYVVTQYSKDVDTDQQGRIQLTRWRVCRPIGNSLDARRIVRDNFASLADAKAFIDQGCNNEEA